MGGGKGKTMSNHKQRQRRSQGQMRSIQGQMRIHVNHPTSPGSIRTHNTPLRSHIKFGNSSIHVKTIEMKDHIAKCEKLSHGRSRLRGGADGGHAGERTQGVCDRGTGRGGGKPPSSPWLIRRAKAAIHPSNGPPPSIEPWKWLQTQAYSTCHITPCYCVRADDLEGLAKRSSSRHWWYDGADCIGGLAKRSSSHVCSASTAWWEWDQSSGQLASCCMLQQLHAQLHAATIACHRSNTCCW